MKNRKIFPSSLDISPLKLFVESNTEIPKKEIISRCAGSIEYRLFQTIKQLIFYSIGKDSNGELYFV